MAEPLSGSANEASAPPVRARDPRWYVPLAVVAALVAVVAVTASLGVALIAQPARQSFPPDSPSAAVLAFVDAVRQGDYTKAEGFVSSRIKAQDDGWQKQIQVSAPDLSDVWIVSESGDGTRAIVAVEVTHFYGSGLSRSSMVEHTNVEMVREADGWKIDSDYLAWL